MGTEAYILSIAFFMVGHCRASQLVLFSEADQRLCIMKIVEELWSNNDILFFR